jgi:hypothetical protein
MATTVSARSGWTERLFHSLFGVQIVKEKTLRIKLKSSIAGNGFAHQIGDVIDWPEEEAKRFIERGIAVSAEDAMKAMMDPNLRAPERR